MVVSKDTLLATLPPFKDSAVIIEKNQDVSDIMQEVVNAHKFYAPDYDLIYHFFYDTDTLTICKNLFRFCKYNIVYAVEDENNQTTRSPSAILVLGNGDCKHYASFIGGVLAAIQRNTGKKIDWDFRFASYDVFADMPGHVFVVCWIAGNDYWIDPVLPTFNDRMQPVFFIDKKPKTMLSRVSGIHDTTPNDALQAILDHPEMYDALKDTDLSIDVEMPLANAITVLMHYGAMDTFGYVDKNTMMNLLTTLPEHDAQQLQSAIDYVVNYSQNAAVGNWFDDAFKFVQHNAAIVGQQVPRAAFLGLVAINAFGYATKLQKALSFDDTHAKLADLWERVGGKFSVLENTINSGAKKKAILKGIEQGNTIGVVAAAAIIAAAATIVAAIMPLITKMLSKHNVPAEIPIDPNTGYPIGYNTNSNPVISWIQNNSVIVLGAVVVVGYFLLFPDHKRRIHHG